jgi:hypothetical protein
MCLLTYFFLTFQNRTALDIEDTGDSPLDAKLDAVLPGVHYRLMANQQEVMNLCSFVAKGFESMTMQILDALVRQEEAMMEQQCCTVQHSDGKIS